MTIYEPASIMHRAEAGYANDKGKLETLAFVGFVVVALFCGLIACGAAEFFALTTALSAQFPPQSDGTDLGQALMAMRYPIVVVLFLSNVILQENAETSGRILRWLRHFRIVPMLALMAGMAVFMFMAMSAVMGGDDGVGGIAGIGLGVACCACFSISFLAAKALAKPFIPALRKLLDGLAARAKVEAVGRDLEEADRLHASIESLNRNIELWEDPRTIDKNVAAEAATIAGGVCAEVTELHASRVAMGEGELQPQDQVFGIPEMPVASLEALRDYLRGFDFNFFHNLLKKEA